MFTWRDKGCYADGTHGDVYVALRTIDLAEERGFELSAADASIIDLCAHGQPGNGDIRVLEEIQEDAIRYLNLTQCAYDVAFALIAGDLVLIDNSEYLS